MLSQCWHVLLEQWLRSRASCIRRCILPASATGTLAGKAWKTDESQRKMHCWWQEVVALKPAPILWLPAWQEVLNKLILEPAGLGRKAGLWGNTARPLSPLGHTVKLDLWLPDGGQILWSFWPLLEDVLRMQKGKICCYRGLLRSVTAACEPESSAALFIAFNLLSQSVRSVRLLVSLLVFFEAILQMHWNFSSSM